MIELLVAMTVVALLATLTFPALQLIQQREKERRLKEILENTRGAIYGTKSVKGRRKYTEGYRTYVIRMLEDNADKKKAAEKAIASGAVTGLLYPIDPNRLVNSYGISFQIASTGGLPPYANPPVYPDEAIPVTINKRFIRAVPPHPFTGWYPQAHWEFRAATYTIAPPPLDDWFATPGAAIDEWPTNAWPNGATGVMDIRSVGAGIALNGENTDDW